jgi:two-component system response regulator RegX3
VPVLLVDDDRELIELLSFALRRAGLEPIGAHDAASAMRQFEDHDPDLVVLDINLGSSSGLDVLQELRRRSSLPVIMLTALDSEEDKVRGLDRGADDYLTKPFSHRELIARIRAQLRRGGQELQVREEPKTRLEVGPLVLNVADHSVTCAGAPVNLTVMEFRLLHCLMSNAGRVVSTNDLLKQVWGYSEPGSAPDVVRVTVHRLRRKLEVDPSKPRLLHTIPGVGFLLRPASSDETG